MLIICAKSTLFYVKIIIELTEEDENQEIPEILEQIFQEKKLNLPQLHNMDK